ncbi:MAG: cytochrome c1, partial [Pseudomonadota bacterium]
MKHLRIMAIALAAGLATQPALGAGGGGHIEDVDFSFEGPFGSFDRFQLQRGFQVYHNVCSACHGMKGVAFRELGDPNGPAFPEE